MDTRVRDENGVKEFRLELVLENVRHQRGRRSPHVQTVRKFVQGTILKTNILQAPFYKGVEFGDGVGVNMIRMNMV